MPTWIPRTEADRLVWLQNFALKLGVHVGEAGIVAGDVTLADGPRKCATTTATTRSATTRPSSA